MEKIKGVPIYQPMPIQSSAGYIGETVQDFSYPAHLHPYPELILVVQGQIHISYDENSSADLHQGMAALFLPNQVHSFQGEPGSKMFYLLFVSELTETFYELIAERVPACPVFTPDKVLASMLLSMNRRSVPLLRAKGILYMACGAFLEQQPPTKEIKSPSSAQELLIYIQEHLNDSRLSLKKIAHDLGYEYHYLSRYLAKILTIPFSRYVQQLRIQQAASYLLQTSMPVSEIAVKCGFHCIRTFNTTFLELAGCSPVQYRKKARSEAEPSCSSEIRTEPLQLNAASQ